MPPPNGILILSLQIFHSYYSAAILIDSFVRLLVSRRMAFSIVICEEAYGKDMLNYEATKHTAIYPGTRE